MNAFIRDYNYTAFPTKILEDISEYNEICKKRSNSFMLFHNNIRSISKNIDHLDVVLSHVNTDFDCLVLTETRNDFDLNLFHKSGYNMIFNFANLNKCDGTVVYLKQSFSHTYKIIEIYQTKAIELNIQKENKTIKITALYRSPSTDSKEFIGELERYLNDSSDNSDVHIIVGDINIDILRDETITDEYFNVLSEFNFTSTINEYTRIQNNTKTCIDHIFIKMKKKILKTTAEALF